MSPRKPIVAAVIPARMGSSRFPGKPLVPILGLPMIEHVRRRVERVEGIDLVFVATCDEEIRQTVEKHGGKVIMTSDQHERATDRVEEASHHFEADVIINVQGDEPMVSGRSLEQVIAPFMESPSLEVQCSCLVYPIEDFSELASENIVKVVLSRSERILYLSRSPLPGKKVEKGVRYYKQSGIMAFTRDFLRKFSRLEPTPLEQKESVDLNRILEHDYWIQGVVTPDETKGVDVPEQVGMIEQAILSDPVQKELFEKMSK